MPFLQTAFYPHFFYFYGVITLCELHDVVIQIFTTLALPVRAYLPLVPSFVSL